MPVAERFIQCVRKISPGDEVWNLRGPMEMPDHTWHALAVCPCERVYVDFELEGGFEQRSVKEIISTGGQLVSVEKPVWVGKVRRIIEYKGECLGEESQLIQ